MQDQSKSSVFEHLVALVERLEARAEKPFKMK
jgi:hypothetical protein